MKGAAVFAVAACLTYAPLGAQEFNAPVKLKAGDKIISVDVGHAHPAFADFDGDGLRDLLVGQYGGGQLRIYRNVGTASAPRFDRFSWFQAGGKAGRVWTD